MRMSDKHDNEKDNIYHLPRRDEHPEEAPMFADLDIFFQNLPPITNLHIEKGGLQDLLRIYPTMKLDFSAPVLVPERALIRALLGKKLELHLFRDEFGREAGYALVSVRSSYGYVLVHMLAIYPYLREQRLGKVAAELLNRRYAGKKGILFELAGNQAEAERACALLAYNGYEESAFAYRSEGQRMRLFVRPCEGTADVAPVAKLLLTELYDNLLSHTAARRRVQTETEETHHAD